MRWLSPPTTLHPLLPAKAIALVNKLGWHCSAFIIRRCLPRCPKTKNNAFSVTTDKRLNYFLCGTLGVLQTYYHFVMVATKSSVSGMHLNAKKLSRHLTSQRDPRRIERPCFHSPFPILGSRRIRNPYLSQLVNEIGRRKGGKLGQEHLSQHLR